MRVVSCATYYQSTHFWLQMQPVDFIVVQHQVTHAHTWWCCQSFNKSTGERLTFDSHSDSRSAGFTYAFQMRSDIGMQNTVVLWGKCHSFSTMKASWGNSDFLSLQFVVKPDQFLIWRSNIELCPLMPSGSDEIWIMSDRNRGTMTVKQSRHFGAVGIVCLSWWLQVMSDLLSWLIMFHIQQDVHLMSTSDIPNPFNSYLRTFALLRDCDICSMVTNNHPCLHAVVSMSQRHLYISYIS